jgi:tetratricopeptide (TPR) repeat protein
MGFAHLNLGLTRYELGDIAAARRDFESAHEAFTTLGFPAQLGHALQGLAATEAAEGRFEDAVALLARAAVALDDVGYTQDDFEPRLAERVEAGARAALGDDRFAALFEAGQAAGGADWDGAAAAG